MSGFIYAFPGDEDNDKPPSTARLTHIRRLNDILHLCIEQRDVVRARRAWSILSRCREFDWKYMWRTGLFMISPDTQEGTDDACLRYLREMMLKYPDDRESVLQEIVLRLGNMGKYRNALDELELYLPSFPYQDNATLHAYAGLLCLQLATQERGTVTGEMEGFGANSANTDAYKNMLRESMTHFEKALSIDTENLVIKSFLNVATIRMEGCSEVAPWESTDPQNSDDEAMQVDERAEGIRKRTKR